MRNRSGKGRARLFLLLVVVAASCHGQNLPRAAEEKPASVEGVAVNSITGAPVPRTHVKLAGNSPGAQHDYGAMTNAEGKFAMTNLPPGSYLLRAERIGFVTFGDDASPRKTEIVLGSGDHKGDVRLKLTPAGAIAGRVVGSAGEPMELVTVVAENRDPAVSSDALTDGDGRFRIGGLRPGTYWVRARPRDLHLPPETRTDGSVEVQYAPTYAQSALSRTSATRIDVPPGGDVSGIEVRLAQVPIISVRGKVLGLPTSATQGGDFSVFLCQPDGECRGFGRSARADGSFQVWRPEPGRNYVTVEKKVGGQVLRAAPVEIEVGESSIDNIELVALPPMDISGRLEYSDPAARQQTSSPQRQGQPPTGPHRLLLREVGGDTSPKAAQVGPDESFKLQGVPAGRFLIRLSWAGAYVKSVRLGTSESDDGILDLRKGYAGQPLTVLVSSAVGQVSGVVRKGDEPAAAWIALVPEGPEGAAFALFTTAGADGTYSFVGIRPGKYTLAALDDDDSEGAVRASGLDIYERFSESVEIHNNEKLTKDLKQRPLDGRGSY